MDIVTFIIPSKGRPSLSNTIESLKNQSKNIWKAIIIFDGINPTIIEHDSRITIMTIEKKGRLNYAAQVRNAGILKVNTKWVAFVDDDDRLTEDYLERFEQEVKKNSDIIIFRMVSNNQIIPPFEHTDFIKDNVGISFAAKTSLFKNDNFWFEESRTEDFDLLDRFRSNGKSIILSKYITYIVR